MAGFNCSISDLQVVFSLLKSKCYNYIYMVTTYPHQIQMYQSNLINRPRSASKQKSFDDKLKAQLLSMNDIVDICEQTILAQCNYTLIGENAMGKILTILRDNGSIDYKIDYPLFLFDNEIK